MACSTVPPVPPKKGSHLSSPFAALSPWRERAFWATGPDDFFHLSNRRLTLILVEQQNKPRKLLIWITLYCSTHVPLLKTQLAQ